MTIETRKNLALYLGGAMAWHTLTHAVLAITRSREPHSKLGIPMTPALNAAATVLWAGVSLLLTRYALSGRGGTATAVERSAPAARQASPEPAPEAASAHAAIGATGFMA